MYRIPMERDYIVREMVDADRKENWRLAAENKQYRQLSLFDDRFLSMGSG